MRDLDRLPRWIKKATPRCCKTCCYWGKPADKRATSGKYYPCRAPIPDALNVPASVLTHYDFRQALALARSMPGMMERHEGANCPAWRDLVRLPPA